MDRSEDRWLTRRNASGGRGEEAGTTPEKTGRGSADQEETCGPASPSSGVSDSFSARKADVSRRPVRPRSREWEALSSRLPSWSGLEPRSSPPSAAPNGHAIKATRVKTTVRENPQVRPKVDSFLVRVKADDPKRIIGFPYYVNGGRLGRENSETPIESRSGDSLSRSHENCKVEEKSKTFQPPMTQTHTDKELRAVNEWIAQPKH